MSADDVKSAVERLTKIADAFANAYPQYSGGIYREVASLLSQLTEENERLRTGDALANALTMTGCRDEADLIDMANVGRSTMDRMAEVVTNGPLKGWSPADDPAEIITDLANKLDDALHDYGNAESEAKGAEQDVAALTERATKAEAERDSLTGELTETNGLLDEMRNQLTAAQAERDEALDVLARVRVMFKLDLSKMLVFGRYYNQAVKDIYEVVDALLARSAQGGEHG